MTCGRWLWELRCTWEQFCLGSRSCDSEGLGDRKNIEGTGKGALF